MDEVSMIEVIMQSGSLAGFAGYLVFQTKQLQKRFDELNKKSENREDMLRGRYDKVISDLQDEKQALLQTTSNSLLLLDKKVDQVISDVSSLKDIVQELKMKDIARDVK